MGIPHNFHDSIAIKDFAHSGWVLLVGGALAGLALVSIAAFTGVGPSSSLDSTVQPATTPLASSALLDGERFAVLVDEAIAGVDVPRSGLLDGERFAVLVDEAIAGVDVPRSGLLDGERFAVLVDEAVAETRG